MAAVSTRNVHNGYKMRVRVPPTTPTNMSANNQLYFRLSLTENEHYIVNDMLSQKCSELGVDLLYYRKLKNGHIPTIREVKVVGEKLYRVQKYLDDEKFILCSKEDVEVQDKYGCESKERFDRFFS